MKKLTAYWLLWALTTAITGIVCGLFLGYFLLLGHFIDWLLVSNEGASLAHYAIFRAGEGRNAFMLFYGILGIQVLIGILFSIFSFYWVCYRKIGLIVGFSSSIWPILHYASGLNRLESYILGGTLHPVPEELINNFVRINSVLHGFYVFILAIAFCALLMVPLLDSKR